MKQFVLLRLPYCHTHDLSDIRSHSSSYWLFSELKVHDSFKLIGFIGFKWKLWIIIILLELLQHNLFSLIYCGLTFFIFQCFFNIIWEYFDLFMTWRIFFHDITTFFSPDLSFFEQSRLHSHYVKLYLDYSKLSRFLVCFCDVLIYLLSLNIFVCISGNFTGLNSDVSTLLHELKSFSGH